MMSVQQEKWWILITVKNIYRVYQTKYYYGSVKKSKFSFSGYLQIGKKVNNVKEIQGEKLIQTFIFPKLPCAYDVLIRKNIM